LGLPNQSGIARSGETPLKYAQPVARCGLLTPSLGPYVCGLCAQGKYEIKSLDSKWPRRRFFFAPGQLDFNPKDPLDKSLRFSPRWKRKPRNRPFFDLFCEKNSVGKDDQVREKLVNALASSGGENVGEQQSKKEIEAKSNRGHPRERKKSPPVLFSWSLFPDPNGFPRFRLVQPPRRFLTPSFSRGTSFGLPNRPRGVEKKLMP